MKTGELLLELNGDSWTLTSKIADLATGQERQMTTWGHAE